MNFASYARRTLRRYLVPVLIFAVLFASLAEASHYHRDQAGQRGDAHVQCLLCLHSAGSAGAPHIPGVARSGAIVRIASLPILAVLVESPCAASYDARGPPTA
jgi:hypothetical protein